MAIMRLFLDVDGVILVPRLPHVGNFDSGACVEFKRNVGGKMMIREEEIRWNSSTASFLQSLKDDVEIFWLTGWKDNAPRVLDSLLGIQSAGWIDWDMREPDEQGKRSALDAFVSQQNPLPFVWVDDVATVQARDGRNPLAGGNLALTTDEPFGIQAAERAVITEFVNIHRNGVKP